MAITEYNMHGADHKDDEKKGKGKLVQFQVPQFYEFCRNKRTTKAIIRDQTKDK